MKKKLTKTVTVQKEVPDNIANMLFFYKYVLGKYKTADANCSPSAYRASYTDDELIGLAEEFWYGKE